RAVVIGGARTPFVKAFAEFMKLDTIALGAAAMRGLLERHPIPRREIDAIVWGGVILPSVWPNIGREIALEIGLDPAIEAMTVTRACASSLQAVTTAAAMIERGEADVVIAGGSDSTSNAEVKLPQKLVHALAPLMFGKRTAADMMGALSQLMPPGDLLPRSPKAVERTTGQLMGEAAEQMARRNEISRAEQDAFALRSHQRAAAAMAAGRLHKEIVPVAISAGWVHTDTIVRGDASLDKLAKLSPAFARDGAGTVTAGTSSPLTDGAASVLLMSEEKAAALGVTALARVTAWSYVGVDPADQLLIGPALAMPRVLDEAGRELADIDLVDMHEAFAAQVLAVLKALASGGFARERLGRSHAVGVVDPSRLNVHGGSLAFGHPFAATGARMVTTMAHELHDTGKATALLGICAQGGLGAAALLENAAT
ncbi:MAG TPA: acetyl-CoA C-acyltransferase, partial [Polyangia bacterium]|nr:acetyl-CoA C-acyltransferase [Polyangia bacterium]